MLTGTRAQNLEKALAAYAAATTAEKLSDPNWIDNATRYQDVLSRVENDTEANALYGYDAQEEYLEPRRAIITDYITNSFEVRVQAALEIARWVQAAARMALGN